MYNSKENKDILICYASIEIYIKHHISYNNCK